MADLRKTARNIASFIKIKNVVPVYKTIDKENEFSGKVAMVIGGTGGIGKAICHKLADGGCSVILSGSKDESVNEKFNPPAKLGRMK